LKVFVANARWEYRRLAVKRPGAIVGLIIAVVVLLVAIAAMLGWAVGHQTASKTKTVAAPAQPTVSVPAGHMGGPNLAIAQIGDPARGARLWQSKRCSDCHSYGGRGGQDAPPLDYMRGHMSAREIADMSGQVWDHLPAMLPHFREEKIPVPTFTQGEMADLIAFLHSGKGAKAGAPPTHPGMAGMSGMGGTVAARGKGVFLAAGCGACHTLAAAGTRATVGPSLDATLKGKSSAFVRESILDANATIAAGYSAGVMPMTYRSQLTSRQIADLVAFLLKRR
jgi:mono/diheme cytochrome c family protein